MAGEGKSPGASRARILWQPVGHRLDAGALAHDGDAGRGGPVLRSSTAAVGAANLAHSGGAASGKGGTPAGSCAPAPVVGPVAATASGSVASCTFSDDLGDFVTSQRLASAAAVDDGGSVAVFVSLELGSTLVLRRCVLDKSAGCKLVRDDTFVPPKDMYCQGLSVDNRDGLWCHGFGLSAKKYGFRRVSR